MTGFVIGAVLAVLLALALLLRPFLRVGDGLRASQRQMNVAIGRDQLARLDQDLAEGSLAAADYAQARAEIERRVLQDTAVADAAPRLHAPRKTLAAVALVLPLVAFGLYFAIGNPAGMNPVAVAAGGSQMDVEQMVAALAAKLQKDPANPKGWAMLARSYKVLGRPLDAERAFERAGAFVDDDAQLLADYADVAAANAGGTFAGKPVQLVEKALKVDPRNPMALWLAGTAAMSMQDYDKAIAIWEGLMKLLPADSEDARMLQGAIDEVRARGGKPAPATALAANGAPARAAGGAVPAAPSGTDATPAAAAASVSGSVELAAALQGRAGPGDTLMVIARAPGSRMPLAVLRVPAAQLPLKFTLDDSLAMSPQALISTAGEVEVEARISKSGQARPQPGDLMSAVQTVKVGSRAVSLQVAQVRP